MLHRVRSGAVIASLALLLTLLYGREASAVTSFQAGDFTTLRQTEYDVSPLLQTAQPFAAAFPDGLTVGLFGVPDRYNILLTSGLRVQDYLATSGPNTVLTTSHFNPIVAHGGQIGGELAALHLNVGFSDAGVLDGASDVPFGDLLLTDLPGLPTLEGLSVREFAVLGDRAISGDPTGFSLDDLNEVSAELNDSFFQGVPSQFAQDHLRLDEDPPPPGTGAVPEPAPAALGILGLLALGLTLVSRRDRLLRVV